MKKSLSIALVLLILLTACQVLPDDDQSLASTPSSSTTTPTPRPTTAPTTRPTTAPTVPTTQPTVPIDPPLPKYEGYSFVYDGEQPYISMTLDLSGCTIGHLYWVDEGSTAVIPIVEEEILPRYNEYLGISQGHIYHEEDGWIYYVKTAEPTKIYRSCRADFSKHELVYESSHGPVVDVGIDDTLENFLQFVAGNKKFFVYDMSTGEEMLMMEMFYIYDAYIGPGMDGLLDDMIFWSGKPTENARHYLYGYSRVTGEVWEEQ